MEHKLSEPLRSCWLKPSTISVVEGLVKEVKVVVVSPAFLATGWRLHELDVEVREHYVEHGRKITM